MDTKHNDLQECVENTPSLRFEHGWDEVSCVGCMCVCVCTSVLGGRGFHDINNMPAYTESF